MEIVLSIKREKLIEHYSKKGYIKEGDDVSLTHLSGSSIELPTKDDNNLLYSKLYDEILSFIYKIKEIKVIKKEAKWLFDEEKDEYVIKIGVETTFSNPLNVITDINRNYYMFKIQLELKKNNL